MCHNLFFGILAGALLVRFLLRRRFGWRRCGHHRVHFGPGGGRNFREARGWRGEWDDDLPPLRRVDPQRLERTLGELELSARQRQEIDEALIRLRESLAGRLEEWPGLPAALAVVGAPKFERSRAEAALDHVSGALRGELADGLEHFHNVLTPEQRHKLMGS